MRTVQSLDLAFFIGTQRDGVFGRIQVKAHDGLQLFGEADIPAEFKGSHQMRFEAVDVSDAPHAGLADARSAGAMVRVLQCVALGRLLMNRHFHHTLHVVVSDCAGSARTGGVCLQGCNSAIEKAVAPMRCFLRGYAQLLGDFLVLQTVSCPKHNARTLHHTGRQGTTSYLLREGLPLFGMQWNRPCNAHRVVLPLYGRTLPLIVIIYDALHSTGEATKPRK